MDPTQGESVAEWLSHAAEKDIANVLYRYGEERKSRWIAKRICETRKEQPITRTLQLANLIESVLGRNEKGKHPATRSFQALRIHINGELDALNKCSNSPSRRSPSAGVSPLSASILWKTGS